jgi:VCBS repeat-containing protein
VAAAAADMATVLAGLSDNDFDFDGDTLQITAIDTSALTGTATLNPDGTISYDAAGAFDDLAEGEVATTTLSYTVTDGRGSVDTATMTITVTGVNDAPTGVWPVRHGRLKPTIHRLLKMLQRGSSLQTSMHRAAFAKLKRRSAGKATTRV